MELEILMLNQNNPDSERHILRIFSYIQNPDYNKKRPEFSGGTVWKEESWAVGGQKRNKRRKWG
jgi:hypothetical protein